MDSESLLSPLGHYRVLTVDRLHAALSLLIDRGYGDMPVTIALDDEDDLPEPGRMSASFMRSVSMVGIGEMQLSFSLDREPTFLTGLMLHARLDEDSDLLATLLAEHAATSAEEN